MKKFCKFIFILFIHPILLIAQYYSVQGTITDSKKSLNLSYANIRIDKSTRGTASNSDGQYKLKLSEGIYSIIVSYIGYRSDTANIYVSHDQQLNFNLESDEIELPQVTVEPGRNPAYDIIKNTIESKNQIREKIENYKYSSYSKGLIKTTRDFTEGGFSLSTKDTAKLKITGILENESRGFYKRPKETKHFIVARKQTANTPPFLNILTGGLLIQSFYEEDLLFMGKLIPSPISDKALKHYYFYIEKELVIDNKKVYQIFFNTDNTADPGFYGKLYIEDKTFHLLKADVNLNQMANPGGLFQFVNIYQQFFAFQNEFVLPIDYRLFAEGNYLGLAKFGFELHTIMNDYNINNEVDEDLFDNAIISVLPEADKKDDNYWSSIQSIPNTTQEEAAYIRIDSLTKVSNSVGQDISFFDPRIKLNKKFSINGPITIYGLNKVEGSSLNFDLFYNDGESQRLNLNIGTSYGFADDLVKKYVSTSYKLGDYRTTNISLQLYDKLTDLFAVSDNYNKFTSTFLSLLSKYDFRDYFYTKGFEFNLESEVFPFVGLGIGYVNKMDESTTNRSDFSIFYSDREYSKNRQIYNSHISGVEASIKLDFRKFIEDGFFRRRITPRDNIQFEGSIFLSENKFLKSDLDFTMINLESFGRVYTVGNWSLDFSGNQILSNGKVPFQWLYAVPGNINAAGKNNSFRTLGIGEVFGDKITTLFFRHNFNDDLFKLSQIPILKELQLQLSTHLNIAMSSISEDSKGILLDNNYHEFTEPFYELGFSLGHILIPLSLEFTWKLNYRGKNNFAFGINTLAF